MTDLLSPDFVSHLERLSLAAKASFSSRLPGPRLGLARGDSIEFDDYREYHPGDDLRHVDWTIYARLGRLFLRLFRTESSLTVHLIVDTSASMAFASHDTTRPGRATCKLDHAARLAAALAYVGIRNGDRVGLATFAGGLGRVLPPHRGKPQLLQLFEALGSATPAGASLINTSLRQYAEAADRTGVAVVLTDAFAPEGCQEGLRYLAWKQFDVTLVHVLDPAELEPRLDDDTELVDLEEDGRGPIRVDASVLEAYRQRVREFTAALEAFCATEHVGYIPALTSASFDDLVIRCVQAGLLRPHA